MRNHLRLAAAAAAVAVLAGCGASVLPQITSERQRVDVAERLLERGDAFQAIEILKPYTTTGTGAADIDRAVYVLGRCYLRQKEWASAEVEFDKLLREYPESDSAASAMFRLGEAYFGQSRGPDFDQEHTLKALQQWQSYLRDAPEGHWLRAQAVDRVLACRNRLAAKLEQTGELYLQLRQWSPAKLYFSNVVDLYPDTSPYGAALIGLSVAEARLGQKESALGRLRELAQQFDGQPLGARAKRTIADIENGKLRPEVEKRTRRSVEGDGVAPAPGVVGG